MRIRTGAVVIVAGMLLLSGCSGEKKQREYRPEKPVVGTVVLEVPGMT